ncbi:hypothetical protein FIV34_11930 [Luteibacter pinisoli]|uniref:Uncharacterized protein n=1 Tax=Luteibacter pinisoli TaxID=2589080 RepID=A0A4Y5Z5M3_9GAMM|nr:hypothetical protein [Luteibacter pinisoli]QDE39869.1 hypothetical protein FIV34_11930 [Luteibacter pinisoli]
MPFPSDKVYLDVCVRLGRLIGRRVIKARKSKAGWQTGTKFILLSSDIDAVACDTLTDAALDLRWHIGKWLDTKGADIFCKAVERGAVTADELILIAGDEDHRLRALRDKAHLGLGVPQAHTSRETRRL